MGEPIAVTVKHLVVGTAGHVDHGKTALVQALTGTDTDRWAEEKRRGITIDLGFALLDLDNGLEASIVDVPGHEDFVRNMVAGATGIDVALLVVAADEGVMPQTREHLEILRFLGISRGVIAITKTDLVDAEWLELVVDDVATTARETVGTGPLVWEDPVCVSSKTGEGLDNLREVLRAVAGKTTGGDASDLFRMPVDRSFSVAGAGTVVTGTTWAGTARVGDEVTILPSGETARVRSIEVHDRSAEQAIPGRRTALALVGVDRESVGRGSFVVHKKYWMASRRVDAFVTLLPGARPLTQRSRIRVHIGTAEIMARITPAADDIPSGGAGMVRLRLDEPLVSRWGDRGVLRAYSPMITVGGCVIVDPSPPPRPRRPSSDPSLRSDQAAVRTVAFVGSQGTISTHELPVRIGVHPARTESVLAEVGELNVERSGETLISDAVALLARQSALAAVTGFHETDPLKPGLSLEAFRKAAGSGPLADFAREILETDRRIVVDKGSVRAAEYTPKLAGDDQKLAEKLLQYLEKSGAEGVTFADIPDGVAHDRGHFAEVAEYLVRQGNVIRIGSDRYYWEAGVRQATRVALEKIGEKGLGPADLREVLKLSRKYLIPLLEWMDGQGITTRDGDVRRKGPKAHLWV